MEDRMFIYKNKGTLQHRDLNVEYNEDGVFKELWYGSFTATWYIFKTRCDPCHLCTRLVLIQLPFLFWFQDLAGRSSPRHHQPIIDWAPSVLQRRWDQSDSLGGLPSHRHCGSGVKHRWSEAEAECLLPASGESQPMSIPCPKVRREQEMIPFILDSSLRAFSKQMKTGGEPAKCLHWGTTVLKTLQ